MPRNTVAYILDGDEAKQLHGRGVVRDGSLESALERIAAGEFSALLVVRLAAIAGSLRETIALLDWLERVGAQLVALDVGLDTGSAPGQLTVAALREIARWEHEEVRRVVRIGTGESLSRGEEDLFPVGRRAYKHSVGSDFDGSRQGWRARGEVTSASVQRGNSPASRFGGKEDSLAVGRYRLGDIARARRSTIGVTETRAFFAAFVD